MYPLCYVQGSATTGAKNGAHLLDGLQNTPDDFQKRVYAQLQAQSIAIAAALALAAKHDNHPEAISHSLMRAWALDETDRILPIDARDKRFAEAHLNDIFAEARKMLAIKHPWDDAKKEGQ